MPLINVTEYLLDVFRSMDPVWKTATERSSWYKNCAILASIFFRVLVLACMSWARVLTRRMVLGAWYAIPGTDDAYVLGRFYTGSAASTRTTLIWSTMEPFA